jgi:hypothetical protein
MALFSPDAAKLPRHFRKLSHHQPIKGFGDGFSDCIKRRICVEMFYVVPDSIQVFELGVTYSDAEVIKAFGYLIEIDRGVTDRLVLYAASSVANRLVLGSKDFIGIGARYRSDKHFLRQKECARVKIPDR